ncbi:hypothetical protein B0H94_10896 [Salsuginibacillus halophilus]|uniref:DUF378 domain-containing protein n=1 Tax=Salsuginibacillus halophilus TaxID=517424 RepID=A0A2P8HE59_9BACI|nr:DUF378 domain-containing protein [Salsuginibacillus halophilus]PSL44485.1 hypothetical protein B0H94_10896 [Salsuginibacillus halophilus]
MNGLQKTALVLIIIGAVNWGLVGFFGFDLVASIFGGQAAAFSRVIYAIIGLAGLYCISLLVSTDHEIEKEPEPQRS